MSAPVVPSPLVARLALQGLLAEREAELSIGAARAGAPAPPEAAEELLSGTARALAALARALAAPAERAQALERAVLTRIGAPHPDARVAGGELRAAFERSGLFYESHLGDWSAGARTREELMREPQARLGAALARAALAPEDPAPAGGAAQRAADAAASPGPALLPRALEALVREQLATLETRTAVLPLLVWPDQEATLAIAEEAQPERDPDAGDGGGRGWQARLALDLPHLGAIELAVSLRADRVEVTARAAESAARAAFASGTEELRAALARNALALERLVLADERT